MLRARIPIALLVLPLAGAAQSTGPGLDSSVQGELRKWLPLEVLLSGPDTDELATSPNPFLDYRLVVTFTAPSGTQWKVPGFYDGDGDGGGSGAAWKVRFSPDEVGSWSWTASFKSGTDLAIELDDSLGAPTVFDGQQGSFEIAAPHPNAQGFLGLGRLEYAGGHYLKFRDGGYFLKGGTDSPENLLGWSAFEDVVDQGGVGIVHDYAPHQGDWALGDPDLGGSSGRGLIGALNYLSSVHVNSVYFLPMNLGGDGQETCPFVGYAKTPFDKTHYDIGRLHGWNRVFEHAQRKGIQLQIVLAETEPENETWLDDGALGVERKLFYRELVARFGHVLAIKWNLCEENDWSESEVEAMAQYLADLDPYDHPIAIHTRGEQFGIYTALLGDPLFDAQSFQYDADLAGAHVEEWRAKSAAAGHPWVVDMDENNPASIGLTDTNADDLRKRVLYDVYFSGGNLEWYAGPHGLPLGGDVTLEDFRTREEMWRYMWHARRVVLALSFWKMEPADHLVTGESSAYGGAEVFALPGQDYAVYLPDASLGGMLDLTGAPGVFELDWYNPRTGKVAGAKRSERGGSPVSIGLPPSEVSKDWVLVVRRQSFWSATDELSLSLGGVQQLMLAAGQTYADMPYQVLGSLSGTTPGVLMPNDVLLPLNWDAWSHMTLTSPGVPPTHGFAGFLNADGTASAALVIAPGMFVGLAGIELHHAFLTGPGTPSFASNPVVVRLVP